MLSSQREDERSTAAPLPPSICSPPPVTPTKEGLLTEVLGGGIVVAGVRSEIALCYHTPSIISSTYTDSEEAETIVTNWLGPST
jgi:hypothetical protein